MRKLIGVGCAALSMGGVVAALAPTPACTTHQCDAPPAIDIYDYGYNASGGDGGAGDGGPEQVPGDPNSWESSPLDGPWLNFPAELTYNFHMPPQFAGREIETMAATISVTNSPVGAQGDNNIWVPDSQEAAEFSLSPLADGGYSDTLDPQYPVVVSLFNNSCAQYWVRVVITFAPATASDAAAEQ